MKLDSWLLENQVAPRDFAGRIGLTAASVSRLRRGRQRPTLATLTRIRDATGGAVALDDWPPQEAAG